MQTVVENQMTYTTESDIEAMAEAIDRVMRNDLYDCLEMCEGELRKIAKAALAASPVHKELERVNAENERLLSVMREYDESLYQMANRASPADNARYCKAEAAFKQALQQKGGE